MVAEVADVGQLSSYPVSDGVTVDLDLVEVRRHLIQSGRCGRGPCR